MFIFRTSNDVIQVLHKIGERLTEPAEAVLYGGCAVILMGRTGRQTDDLDLDCRNDATLLAAAQQVAKEMDGVADVNYTVERFIDVPANLLEPHERYGQFGLLDVYLCDPAIIATSKLDRRSSQDMKDIQWLLSSGRLSPERFRQCVEACNEFDDRRKALETMRNLLGLTQDQPATLNKPAQRRSRWWLWTLLIIALLIALVWVISS
jgi:hypothetical protein